MAKFVIECPSCGKYAEARTGFFARKKIDCACGHVIDVRLDKLTSRDCPQCGTKGITFKFCPECGAKKPEAPQTWNCPQCGMKNIKFKFCPECGAVKPE